MFAEIDTIKIGIMGTAEFNLKVKGMRKPQNFCVYPIKEADPLITIQSDRRIAQIDINTGKGKINKKSYSGGAYFHHLSHSPLMEFQLSESDLQALKEVIFNTASKRAGSSIVKSDNSGAINIFDL